MGTTRHDSLGGTRLVAGGAAPTINVGQETVPVILFGSGLPTVTAPQGSLYLRSDSPGAVYVNTDGAATWVVTAAGSLALAGQTAGDLIIATSATALGRLADAALKQVLMSGGVGVAPAFSGSPEVSGNVRADTKETDGEVFIPAIDFIFDVGTWTSIRSALGNYFIRKTAAANVSHPTVNFVPYLTKKIGADPGAHDIRGYQITAIDLVYGVTVDVLAAHTAAIGRTTYANNAAPSVATLAVPTGTLAVAVQAQPYLTTLTITPNIIVGANLTDVAEWFELTVDTTGHATTVYDLYGAFVRFNYNLL